MDPEQLQQTNPVSVDAKPADTTAMERLVALRLLRENMFYDQPGKYSATDIAEDLPGALRPLGGVLKNVLPSTAIISEDPEQRKQQIDKAIARIKSSKSSKENLKKEIFSNVKELGMASIPASLGLSAAAHILGLRMPWVRRLGHLGPPVRKGFRLVSPITPLKNLGKLLSGAGGTARKQFLKNVAGDTLTGVGMASLGGAIYPMLAHGSQVSDKALEEARKIMEEQPYITSLPTSEMLSVIKQKADEKNEALPDKLKNVGLGTGLGAAIGAGSAVLPAAFNVGISLLPGARRVAGGKLLKNFIRDARANAIFGGLMGGVSGAVTKNLVDDEYNNVKNHLANIQAQKEQQSQEI